MDPTTTDNNAAAAAGKRKAAEVIIPLAAELAGDFSHQPPSYQKAIKEKKSKPILSDEAKVQLRLEANRKAARESRRRKKVLVEELQRSVRFFCFIIISSAPSCVVSGCFEWPRCTACHCLVRGYLFHPEFLLSHIHPAPHKSFSPPPAPPSFFSGRLLLKGER